MGSLRALALAVALIPTVASAQQPKAPTPQQVQQAGELVKKAIAKSQAGEHLLAIELYQQAYNIAPAPILLSNIGSEYQQISKPADALKNFCKYLEADPTGSNATYATAQVKSLQIQLGNQVDDKDVCKPIPKVVVKQPPPIDTHQGSGSGEGSGSTGAGSGAGLSGTEFGSSSGSGSDTGTTSGNKPNKTLEYAGLGIGVVGLVFVGLGIDYGLKAKSLNDQINAHVQGTPWPSNYDGVPIADWDSQGHSWNTDTIVFSIVGGVAVIAGGAMFIVGHKGSAADHAEHTAIVPSANQHGGGVTLLGHF
jgi:tetratricopeptide (TPR) repeat protein